MRRQNYQRGFSQIEVLVAIVIVSLIALVVFDWLIGGLTQAGRSSEHSTAVGWAQGEIDYLRLQCFERLQPGSRKVTPATLQRGEPSLPPGLKAAYVVLEASGPAYLRATVAVYRQDWAGIAPPAGPPVLETTTFIGDVRTAGQCP